MRAKKIPEGESSGIQLHLYKSLFLLGLGIGIGKRENEEYQEGLDLGVRPSCTHLIGKREKEIVSISDYYYTYYVVKEHKRENFR